MSARRARLVVAGVRGAAVLHRRDMRIGRNFGAMLLALLLAAVSVHAATFYNNISRTDVDGNIIDCHSGVCVDVGALCGSSY